MKAINKADSSKELKVLESDFRGVFNRNQLEKELHLIPANFKQSVPVNVCEICKTFQDMDNLLMQKKSIEMPKPTCIGHLKVC